jgi:hypothetical protein
MYKFWVQTDDALIEWTRLTKQQAVRLYNLTEKNTDWSCEDCPIRSFAWEEMK